MKNLATFVIFIFFICFIIDCSSTQNLTNKKMSRMEQEIDSVFNVMVKAAENFDTDKLRQGVDDRYQAGFITNGIYYAQFDSLMKNFSKSSKGIIQQNISFQNKKITVLSSTLALLTTNGETRVDVADGKTFNIKFFWSFVYARINDQWKVIQSHQSR